MLTNNFVDGFAVEIQCDDSVVQRLLEVHQCGQLQGRHVGLAPALAAIFHIFLELDPSKNQSYFFINSSFVR